MPRLAAVRIRRGLAPQIVKERALRLARRPIEPRQARARRSPPWPQQPPRPPRRSDRRYEKYDVIVIAASKPGGGGEYPTQDGFDLGSILLRSLQRSLILGDWLHK